MIYKIFGFVILPALLAAFFASFIPRKLNERQKFIEAATEFRKIFNQTLVYVRDDTASIIDFAFGDNDFIKSHRVAYLNFRSHLGREYHNQYDEAWNRYYNTYRSQWGEYRSYELTKGIEQLLEFTKCGLLRSISFHWHNLWFKKK